MGRLDGKVALVTGAGSGIGSASAARLADEGARVVIVDRQAEAGAAVADRLGGLFLAGDVGDPARWAAMVKAAESDAGGIDIVHLNAGVTTGESDIVRVTDDQYRRSVGANVDGVVFGARAVVPALEKRGGGAIVATASLAGLIAFSPDPVYTLTKHAVVGLVRALAPHLQPRGITINALCPGLVDTPILGDEARSALDESGFPLIPPSDIAEAVLGCALGRATGQAYVCQAGAEPVAYRFAGVPGPRAQGAEGRVPPSSLAAYDQG